MNIKKIIEDIGGPLSLQSKDELIKTIEAIDIAQSLTFTAAEMETLHACHKEGPLFDGNVPSKAARDALVERGAIVKVVVKGQCGYNACTYWGVYILNALNAITKDYKETSAPVSARQKDLLGNPVTSLKDIVGDSQRK